MNYAIQEHSLHETAVWKTTVLHLLTSSSNACINYLNPQQSNAAPQIKDGQYKKSAITNESLKSKTPALL